MGAALLIAKNLFGKIFGDWRIILAILLFGAATVVYFKINKVYKDLDAKTQEVKDLKGINQNLGSQLQKAVDINKSNEIIIDQIQKDKQLSASAVKGLASTINKNAADFAELQNQIRETKEVQQVSPLILRVIDTIQKKAEEKEKQ